MFSLDLVLVSGKVSIVGIHDVHHIFLLLKLIPLFVEQIRYIESDISAISSYNVFSPSKLEKFRSEFAKGIKGIRFFDIMFFHNQFFSQFGF